MAKEIEEKIQKIYPLLENFDITCARDTFSNLLVEDISNQEILFCLKVCAFWINHKEELLNAQNFYEQAETLLLNWKEFLTIIQEEANSHEQCMFAIRKGVFNSALNLFSQALNEFENIQRIKIISRIAICHKELGNYETALKLLINENAKSSQDASIIAELADCYALCGDEKQAKLLFREAFYIGASSIDVNFLKSQIFCVVYEETKKRHKNENSILEWIPVEGQLLGIFNVIRKLSAIENGKLKQDIFALENELKSEGSQPEILIPRLINKYIWLIEHYRGTNSEEADYSTAINDNLLKIKWLDTDIYQRYTV